MYSSEIALPVRPGEHACCRFARREDRERLTIAFIRAGLERRLRVIYLCETSDSQAFVDRLRDADERVAPALASGQLELRAARTAYLPDGTFDPDRVVASLADERSRALARGYGGIAVVVDVSVVYGQPGAETIQLYERQFHSRPPDLSHVLLCHYRPERIPPAELTELAAQHDVDASPELAPIGREGPLSAVRVHSDQALRLAGELDFDGAPAVGDVLTAHFHGPLRLDLADLTFVDVAGMRALRGRTGQPVTIAGASEPVRRLAELLAWDTDPDVELSYESVEL
jgi:ABC-type transporter Mla MlaB component